MQLFRLSANISVTRVGLRAGFYLQQAFSETMALHQDMLMHLDFVYSKVELAWAKNLRTPCFAKTKFGRRRLESSAHLGSFSKNNKAVLSYCISMLNDTRTVKTNLKRFIIGKERLSAWATRKKMPFLELFQHFVIFLCWFFHFIRLLNIKTTTFRAAILEMSEILKLPTENKVIL